MNLSATVQRVAFFFVLLLLVCLHLFNLVFNCFTEFNCNKYPSVTVTTSLRIYFCFLPAGGDALVVIGNGEAVSKKKKKTRLLNLKRIESVKIKRH